MRTYKDLKQLDKIEYLLLRKRLEDSHSFSLVSNINQLFYILFGYLLFALLLFGFFESTILMEELALFMSFWRITLVIIVVLCAVNYIIYYLGLKKLNKHFFT